MDYVVRGGNWYFAELNLWRVLDEVDLPELKRAMDKYTPAGSHMGVEWPEEMEALSATIKQKVNDPRIRSLYGREPGDYVTATYYENLVSYRDGSKRGRRIILRGLLNGQKQDAVKGLKTASVASTFSTLVYYHDIYDGRTIHRFDFFGGPGQTLVDGANPFAAMATNLALDGGVVL